MSNTRSTVPGSGLHGGAAAVGQDWCQCGLCDNAPAEAAAITRRASRRLNDNGSRTDAEGAEDDLEAYVQAAPNGEVPGYRQCAARGRKGMHGLATPRHGNVSVSISHYTFTARFAAVTLTAGVAFRLVR